MMNGGDLLTLLTGSLSNVADQRAACEAQLTNLLQVPGFASELCKFMCDPACGPDVRQLSCLLLKKLILSHWVLSDNIENEDNATNPASYYVISDEEKHFVRQQLVHILSSNQLAAFSTSGSKLQTAFCLILSSIFERDWPDQWPDILPCILNLLADENSTERASFAIRFLSLARSHFSSEHGCELVSLVFPHLQRIYVHAANNNSSIMYSIRPRIIRIVQDALLMVGMEAHVGNSQAEQMLQNNVMVWIEIFMKELAPISMTTQDHEMYVKAVAIKIQVLNALSAFVAEWPKKMGDLLPQIFPVIFTLLHQDIPAFEQQVVLCGEQDVPEEYDSDDEGSLISHSALVVSILEFIRATLQAPTKKTRKILVSGIGDLVSVIVPYLQITDYQLALWESDPNQYIADEDDDSLAYNIRQATMDLLTEFEAVLGRKIISPVINAAQSRLNSPETNAAPNCWRLQEASLLVLGCLSSPTLNALGKPLKTQIEFDLPAFLSILYNVMNSPEHQIYLRARALWCAARYANGITEDQVVAFLAVASSGLDQGQALPVRMVSCRAIGSMIQDSTQARKTYRAANAESLIAKLITLADAGSPETLHIALETLVVLLQSIEIDEPLSLNAANAVVQCSLKHWSAHLNDHLIAELTDSCFAAVLKRNDPEVTRHVFHVVLPALRTLLTENSGSGVSHAGSSVTVLKTLLRRVIVLGVDQNSNSLPGELSNIVIGSVFEPLIQTLRNSDEDQVLQRGTECLKLLVLCAVGTLSDYKTGANQSGVECIMDMASHILSVATESNVVGSAGGLITQILLQLGPNLPLQTVQSILQAVATRLANTNNPSIIQSLLFVFIRLVHSHGVTLLDVLTPLPCPSPTTPYGNLLEFVFATWINNQQEFYGLYSLKVSISALVKVLEWMDPRVLNIQVPGTSSSDANPNDTVRRTRSKSKQQNLSQASAVPLVHFLTKAVVVLARALTSLSEEEEEWQSSDDEEDDDEDILDGDASKQPSQSSVFAPADNYELLSDRLDEPDDVDEDAAEDNDFEAQLDPLSNLDLKACISNALKAINSNETLAQTIYPELTSSDKTELALATSVEN